MEHLWIWDSWAVVGHLSFIFHFLCLWFWKFWNTKGFLVLLGIEFWEEIVAEITESTFGIVPSAILVLRGKKFQRAHLYWGEKEQNFKIHHSNKYFREGDISPSLLFFLLHFLLLFNGLFLGMVIPPCKLYEKYFQSSNCISKYATF